MEFELDEIVKMKKPHACGSIEWQIKRIGADFKMQCLKCGHQVMMSRSKFERSFVKRTQNNYK